MKIEKCSKRGFFETLLKSAKTNKILIKNLAINNKSIKYNKHGNDQKEVSWNSLEIVKNTVN